MMMRQVDVLEVRPKKRVLSIRNRQEQFAFYSVIAAAGTARGLRSSCSFSPGLCCFHNSPGPAAAEHLRQKFVGQRDPLRINSVLAHEQPARQALIEFMQAVAGRDLGYLQPLRQNVPIKM